MNRHSVWIDVAGVVLLLALLAAPLAYLIPSLFSGAGGSGGSVIAGSTGGSAPGSFGPASPARTSAPGSAPIFSGSGAGRGGATPTPFSDQWRDQATPDLAGPSGNPVGAGLGGSVDVGGPTAEGAPPRRKAPGGTDVSVGAHADRLSGEISGAPPIAARGVGETGPSLRGSSPRAIGAGGSGGGRAASRAATGNGQSRIADEAQQLAGRMQTLSGQLRQMEEAQSQSASAEQTSSDPGSPEDPDRRNPGAPENVPIGDHLHWLVGAGVLWGIWRLS